MQTLTRALDIKRFNLDARRDPYMQIQLWGGGKFIGSDSEAQHLFIHIWNIQHDPEIHNNFSNPQAVIDALHDKPNGVVAIGATNKTVYTLIRID